MTGLIFSMELFGRLVGYFSSKAGDLFTRLKYVSAAIDSPTEEFDTKF